MLSVRLVLCAAICAAATAQVPISGTIYDGSGGPLQSGVVYHTTYHLTIPAGRTLTVQAGAIVKLEGHAVFVDGTLLCQGTAASPVIFTSIHDDTAGGDTNGNGNATVPAAGQWHGIEFRATAGASRLARTSVRFGGAGWWSGLQCFGANPRFTDCTVSDAAYGGLRLDATARPTVARTAFLRIAGQPAIYGNAIEALPGFTNNTASDCPGGNYQRTDDCNVSQNTAISTANTVGGVLVFSYHISVAAGATLTLGPGVVTKSIGALAVFVDGTLLATGTAAQPVVLTSFYDDTAGGDTNGDGNATGPAPGQWHGIELRAISGPSRLEHAALRYTGAGWWSALNCFGASPTVTDCVFSDGGYGGLRLDPAARPIVARCRFVRVAGQPAILGGAIVALPGFTDNTATDCSGGNYQRSDDSSVGQNTALSAANCLGGVVVYSYHLSVAAGVTLTLGPGIVMKPIGALAVFVDGALMANGTAGEPVVFTSFQDDTAGGDTNGDGNATLPAPGQWHGIEFHAGSDASRLEHTALRYTGASWWAALNSFGASPTFTDCAISDAGYGGVALDANARPTVARTAFLRVAGRSAVAGAAIAAVPGFTDNTASDCSGGNYIRVEDTTVSGHVTIGADNVLGGALVLGYHLSVPQNDWLSLDSGVVLKPLGALFIDVAGRLDVRGPVVFTSFQDDVYGGDTNGDGNATVPAPGQWIGVRLQATATGTLDLALVRYTGASWWPALSCSSPNVHLRRCRAESAGYGGFALLDAASAQDLVAFVVQGNGIELGGGAFELVRSTSAYNSGYGVAKSTGWTGRVRSTIAWGNGSGGFQGFATGDVVYSDGPGIPSGGSGNKNTDPRFVAAAAGDLRLQPTSPCVDAGAPADAPSGRDPLGFPRYLDGKLTGVQRVDMGAYEYDNVLLLVSGTPTPGGTVTFTSVSAAPILLGLMVLGVESPTGLPLFNFGNLYIDLAGPFVSEAWPPNGAVTLTIPASMATPVTLGFQLVGLGNPFPRGNTSNPVSLTIR